MQRNYLAVLLALIMSVALASCSYAQGDALPLQVVAGPVDHSKPMIIYITGDGGWNSFSATISKLLAAKGYPVVALNSKKYFWKKKTAQQTGQAIEKMISDYSKTWNKDKIILLGYSFGADVLPFGYTFLSETSKRMVQKVVLLSPSGKTDFEIHLSYSISLGTDALAVVKGINNLLNKPIDLIAGEDEEDFKFSGITNKNCTITKLPGGHHYDGDEERVVGYIIKK